MGNRRQGSTSSGGTSNSLSVVVNSLELSSVDFNENTTVSFSDIVLEDGNTVRTSSFDDVIQNFQFSLSPAQDGINDPGSFAFENADRFPLSFDLSSLNLTGRYIPQGSPVSIADGTTIPINMFDFVEVREPFFEEDTYDVDTIEYGLNSDELRSQGIAEFTFGLEDQDINRPGIQIAQSTIIDPSDPASTEGDISIEDAIGNPETILNFFSSGLDTFPFVRYNAFSSNDENSILGVNSLLLNDFYARPTISTFSLILEAEELALDNYLIEDYVGGQLVSRRNTSEDNGTASLIAGTHNLSGNYDLNISYFDENDGDAELKVLINDTVVGTLILSEDTNSNIATEDNRREFKINNLDIEPSDTITILGTSNGEEFARVDSLEITSNSTTIEAEFLSLPENTDTSPVGNYAIEDYEGEGQIISLVGESGEARLNGTEDSFDFVDEFEHGLSGLYNLEINYFDVSGDATLEVLLAPNFRGEEVVIDTINLNNTTDSILPSEDNRQSVIIENLDIGGFDDLILRGTSNSGDRVSIDNINITASSFIIEAEDLITPDNNSYLIEDYEGGKLISRQHASGDIGEVSFSAEDYDLSGTFDIGISYFDENDGEAEIEISITDFNDENIVSSQSLLENTSSELPTENNRREFIIEDVDIFGSEIITIRGIEDNFEWARIDSITFYTSDVNTDFNTFDSLNLPDI